MFYILWHHGTVEDDQGASSGGSRVQWHCLAWQLCLHCRGKREPVHWRWTWTGEVLETLGGHHGVLQHQVCDHHDSGF